MLLPIHGSASALQEQINRVPVGGTIRIDQAGEYEGPFVIDRPMTLVGRKQLTPLWRRKGPILLVRVPGVILRDLVMVVTQPDDLPAILYLENCQPNLTDVEPTESHLMSERNLIDLGKLKSGQNLTLQFEFEDSFPFNDFEQPLPNYLEIVDARHNRHARRLVAFHVHVPKEAGYIVDGLMFKDSQSANTQKYMVTGQISDSASVSSMIALKATQRSGRMVYLPTALVELADEQLKLITGSSNVKAGRSAYIMTDDQGENPFLWIPFRGGHSVTFGRDRLYPWSRRALEVGQRFYLSQADTELEVVKVDRLPLTFEPPGLNFTNVSDINARLDLQININQKTLKNRLGLGTRRLTAVSLVPWLKVQSSIEVDASGLTLEVALTPGVLRLKPDTQYVEPSAIAFYDEKEVYFLPVRLSLALPEYALGVPSTGLVLASDSPMYAGEVPEIVMNICVLNGGQKPITLEVTQKPDWLDFAKNVHLPISNVWQTLNDPIPPGEEAEIGVRLNPPQGNRLLRAGDHNLPDAVKLRAVENGQEYTIGVKINLLPERKPVVRIENVVHNHQRELNLDALRRIVIQRPNETAKPRPGFIARRMVLKNHGQVNGHYRVTTSHPALIFIENAKERGSERQEFVSTLGPGQEASLIVQFSQAVFRQARVGDVINFIINIESSKDGQAYENTDQQPITVTVVNKQPAAQFSPPTLELDSLVHNQDFSHHQEVVLTNTGDDDLEGQLVVNAPYRQMVKLSRQNGFTLQQGGKLSFTIQLDKGLAAQPPGHYKVEDIVSVMRRDLENTMSQPPLARLSLEWTIEPAEPRPQLHTLAGLWFGVVEINAGKDGASLIGDELPSRDLVIGNYGHESWQFQLHIDVPWLETVVPSGSALSVPPRQVLRLPIRVNDRAAAHGPSPLFAEQAVRLVSLNTDRQPDVLSARVLLVEPSPEIEVEPKQLFLGKMTAGQRLPLRHGFTLYNHGKIDWYYDPHASGSRRQSIVAQRVPDKLPAHAQSTDALIAWNTEYPADIVSKPTSYSDEYHLLDANQHGAVLFVEYEVHPAHVEIQPHELSLRAGASTSASPFTTFTSAQPSDAELFIHNHGGAPFLLTIDTYDASGNFAEGNLTVPSWVVLNPAIPPEGLVIDAGSMRRFKVSVQNEGSFVGQANIILRVAGQPDLICRMDVS